MDVELIKELEDSIISVFGEENEEINFKKKEIKLFKHKYSSSSEPSITLFLDDIPLTGRTKFHVKYKCSCGRIHVIYLSKFLKKNRLKCSSCREDEEKVQWHKLFFKLRKEGKERGNKIKKVNVYDFNLESDDFKNNYYKRNLTKEEFDIAKKFIYSIQGEIVYNKDMTLIEHAPSKNGKKYSQWVDVSGKKIRLTDIQLKCPLCGDVFHITRMLKERVLAYNFDCKKCYLNNKTFAVKKIHDNLTYQGKLEERFINKCLEKNIEITNGFKIPYTFNNQPKLYTVDFFLPKEKKLIEIKDNHVWHRRQVESGRWGIKENAALKYCEENGYSFHLLFPKDIDLFIETIERDSLNSIERIEKLR